MNNSNPSQQYIKKSYTKTKYDGEADEVDLVTHFRANKNEPLPIELVCNIILMKAKELLYTIENNNVTLVIGETGCGKTTSKLIFLT